MVSIQSQYELEVLDSPETVLIPYQQGSLFRPNRKFGRNIRRVLIPYQQGSLFRLYLYFFLL